jgi:hypothetical protein
MEGTITAGGVLSQADYLSAYRADQLQTSTPLKRFGRRFFFVLPVAATVAFFLCPDDSERMQALRWVLGFAMFIGWARVLGLFLTGSWVIRSRARSLSEEARTVAVTIDEAGLTYKAPLIETTIRWEFFIKVVESPSVFLLYESPESYIVIPYHVFDSPDSARRFGELARRMIGDRQPASKSKSDDLEEL